MLLVGFVAGGLFMMLRLRTQSLAAPVAAHLALNAVEYLSVALGR
jgi:membrane protease YdiL (CAAX protease family)